jgi:hypothetical protein
MNSKTLSRALMVSAAGAILLAQPLTARERLTGEAQLAKMLEGRVAGKPVDCIDLQQASNSTIIDKTAIVYSTGVGTLYVNRPDFPESLDDDDILVTKTWGSQLCRLDIVRLHNRSGGFFHGSVGLSSFVPYTLPPKPKTPKPAAG